MSDASPRRFRHHPSRRGGAVVFWGLVFVVIFKLGLLGVDFGQPYCRDPEFGRKIDLLRAQWTQHPDRPLLLALGSSRMFNGLRPEVLTTLQTPDGELVSVFNFGMVGAGPIHQNLFFRRILSEGIRPRHLIMEVYPALLHHLDTYNEQDSLNLQRMNWRDLQQISHYLEPATDLQGAWLKELVWQRGLTDPLLQQRTQSVWKSVDAYGWLPWDNGKITEPPPDFAERLEKFRTDYYQGLVDFKVSERADRALRDALALCQAEGIPVTLLRMPEHSQLRGWYPPRTIVEVDEYLSRLCTEFQISQVDARTWCGDDVFVDGHHLMANGATAFTRALGRTVLQPLVDGSNGQPPSVIVERAADDLR